MRTNRNNFVKFDIDQYIIFFYSHPQRSCRASVLQQRHGYENQLQAGAATAAAPTTGEDRTRQTDSGIEHVVTHLHVTSHGLQQPNGHGRHIAHYHSWSSTSSIKGNGNKFKTVWCLKGFLLYGHNCVDCKCTYAYKLNVYRIIESLYHNALIL